MIEYKRGDLLTEDVEALVNSVNCVGVMGRGVALQFKKAYPANFKVYEAACRNGEVRPGQMFVHETHQLTNPRYIINFPTKRHWRGKSRIEDIEAGLRALVEEIKRREIRSIALPPLGCGNGGLRWFEVRPLIERALAPLGGVRVVVFEPGTQSDTPRSAVAVESPVMTPGRAALVGLMDRYLAGLMDLHVSLLEVHKLMYFMQEAGEPLKLKYVQAPYGPYAENLRHVLTAIEGHLIAGYADGGDNPTKELELLPGAVEAAATVLDAHPETRAHFDRVAALVEGFESPFGLELLSTVHWVVSHQEPQTVDGVVTRVYDWGAHKRQFSPQQIQLALEELTSRGWLPPVVA